MMQDQEDQDPDQGEVSPEAVKEVSQVEADQGPRHLVTRVQDALNVARNMSIAIVQLLVKPATTVVDRITMESSAELKVVPVPSMKDNLVVEEAPVPEAEAATRAIEVKAEVEVEAKVVANGRMKLSRRRTR
jgi:hypothetical protein